LLFFAISRRELDPVRWKLLEANQPPCGRGPPQATSTSVMALTEKRKTARAKLCMMTSRFLYILGWNLQKVELCPTGS
jgi:hypothetical protein